MLELVNDPFYKMIDTYKYCIIDYCIIKNETHYQGKSSHKDVLLFAMFKITERYIDTQFESNLTYFTDIQDEQFPYNLDIEKADAHLIDSSTFLYVPEIIKTVDAGHKFYNRDLPDSFKTGQIPYWYAFLSPPHTSEYTPNDFHKINSMIFPKGSDELEVYEWTTDWSNYFNDGHEWWGTACWSVYDKRMDRYTVIAASATD